MHDLKTNTRTLPAGHRRVKRSADEAHELADPNYALHLAANGDGGDDFLTCRWCHPPRDLPTLATASDGSPTMSYPWGSRGGYIKDFPDADFGDRLIHWIEVFDREDADMPYPADALIPLVHLGAMRKTKAKTVYAYAQRLTSYCKINGYVFFKRDDFFRDDLPVLDRRIALARAEAEEDRMLRRADGAILRSGRHVLGCLRDHRGRCDHRLIARERARVTKGILDKLGK